MSKKRIFISLSNRGLNTQWGTEINTVIHPKWNEHNLKIIFLQIKVFKEELEYKKIIQRTEIHDIGLSYEIIF